MFLFSKKKKKKRGKCFCLATVDFLGMVRNCSDVEKWALVSSLLLEGKIVKQKLFMKGNFRVQTSDAVESHTEEADDHSKQSCFVCKFFETVYI